MQLLLLCREDFGRFLKYVGMILPAETKLGACFASSLRHPILRMDFLLVLARARRRTAVFIGFA